MVLPMSTTNRLNLPNIITAAMKFNFNSIFYVLFRSEEISSVLNTQNQKPIQKQSDDDAIRQNGKLRREIIVV